ncbi:hypothetical protein ACDZ28_10820 [Paenibacillus sp. RS8]|uniref:hypothetical protein n=1 Tax=Paenibacillus sp. RS8 TaxID=3242681 RepID=UPI0035C092F9
MPLIRNRLAIEMEPTVPEVCAVISAVSAYYPGREVEFIEGIMKALNDRLLELKETKREDES